MDFLQQILPKDLVNIIEGYYYDPWKEKYNDVISEMNNAKYLDDIFNPMNQNNFWFYGYQPPIFLTWKMTYYYYRVYERRVSDNEYDPIYSWRYQILQIVKALR